MTTLTVGIDKQYQTIAAAINASQDGDIINVDAGTYTNDFAYITTDITLNAVGGMVHVDATAPPPDALYTSAIFITDGNITINGFEFSGANWEIVDSNGCAGVRMLSGDLTLTNCYFHDNNSGVLGGGDYTSDLVIDNCEFDHNGDGTSNSYAIAGGNYVSVTDSYIHDTVGGSEIKSGAAGATIVNNRIQDEDGSASYCIDAPLVGLVTIHGNVIEQGPNTQNPAIISFGTEGVGGLGGGLGGGGIAITDNIIINDYPSSSAVVVVSPWIPYPSEVQILFIDNEVYGLTASQLPSNQTGTTFLTEEPILDTSHPFTMTPPPPPPPPPIDLVLIGDIMRNTLTGNDGNDILDGKRNRDTLITGEGHDTIVFSTPLGKLNVDTCFDFNSVNDTMQLSASIFTDPSLLYLNSNTGILRYDGTPFVVLPIGLTLTDINIKIV